MLLDGWDTCLAFPALLPVPEYIRKSRLLRRMALSTLNLWRKVKEEERGVPPRNTCNSATLAVCLGFLFDGQGLAPAGMVACSTSHPVYSGGLPAGVWRERDPCLTTPWARGEIG